MLHRELLEPLNELLTPGFLKRPGLRSMAAIAVELGGGARPHEATLRLQETDEYINGAIRVDTQPDAADPAIVYVGRVPHDLPTRQLLLGLFSLEMHLRGFKYLEEYFLDDEEDSREVYEPLFSDHYSITPEWGRGGDAETTVTVDLQSPVVYNILKDKVIERLDEYSGG